jgi:hypothetical protein
MKPELRIYTDLDTKGRRTEKLRLISKFPMAAHGDYPSLLSIGKYKEKITLPSGINIYVFCEWPAPGIVHFSVRDEKFRSISLKATGPFTTAIFLEDESMYSFELVGNRPDEKK